MNVQNIKELEGWMNKLLTNNFKFLRFLEYPAGYLHMNWKDELIKHGRLYEKDHRHFTFHHIRLLLKALKKNKIKHPLVGIAHESQIQINPGGSRLMVAKKLRIPTVPLDYICRADNVHLARNTQYKEIKDVDTFLEPSITSYENNRIFWRQFLREQKKRQLVCAVGTEVRLRNSSLGNRRSQHMEHNVRI